MKIPNLYFHFITCFFILYTANTMAQTGTYRLNTPSGAWCNIAITQNKQIITGEVFAWWNDAGDRVGSFEGNGKVQGNKCVLINTDHADCKIQLNFNKTNLHAIFNDCMSTNLPEDFSGRYRKINNHIPGTYTVAVNKAHFYKTAKLGLSLKAYLLKGDKVNIDLENIADANRVFINYKNALGKISSGYISWADLKPYR
ncbi:hypothetical protein [Mucilaginibacter terrae]|nr:hypothetical protein [Mucilaginibacter terrae]